MRWASSVSDTLPSPRTDTASITPGWATNSCAVGRSNSAHVAPPDVSASPNRTMPVTVNSRLSPVLATLILSPTLMSPFLAVFLSTTT
jgi:hypothetical protein